MTSIGPGQKWRNSHVYVPFTPQDDFHTYAFEWTPDYIAWFIDDREIYRQDQSHVGQFVFPQKIMMNLWSSEYSNWVGPWDDRILPIFAWYDWASYAAYTPGAGNCGTGQNFTLQWKDEFDSWDQARWGKGTHTFGGNRVTFKPENVFFKDGCMVLAMTSGANLGYTDKTAPVVLWARAEGDTVTLEFSEDVEAASANLKSSYSVIGATIKSAELQADRRTVKLAVPGLDPARSYNVVALGIKDTFVPANRLGGQVQPIIMARPVALPLKINVGGPAWRDYLPDQEWGPAVEYGYQDGAPRDASKPVVGANVVANTEEDTLYYSERHEVTGYRVRLPRGRYKVTLKMAEMTFAEPNMRIFNLFAEGQKVANRIDLAAQPGPRTAFELVVDDQAVLDGILDLHFEYIWGYDTGWGSLLNGLTVEASTAGADVKPGTQPQAWATVQNWPNPFNAATTVAYELPSDGVALLRIYDRLGRHIEDLAAGPAAAGQHKLSWNPDLPSGVYFLALDHQGVSGPSRTMHKLVLLR